MVDTVITSATVPTHIGAPRRLIAALALCGLLALVPLIAGVLNDPFLIRVFTRAVIFGMAAVALNFVLGFGGMVSLLHAGLIGVGGYVVAILAYHDFGSEPLPFGLPGTSDIAISAPLALLASAIVAAITGFISLRTTGTYFIMITLAFNQMIYYFFVSLQQYGGDDGLQIQGGLTFLGRDVTGRVTFYYISLGALLLTLVLVSKLVDSRFGIVLRAAAQNERRVVALGIPPLRYKLLAFVISGMLTGLAGVLLATGQQFISPVDMSWVRSGDLVVMAVLGGVNVVWGPLVGAIAFVMLELLLESWMTHWQLVFGLLIVLMITFLRGGLADLWRHVAGHARRKDAHG
jgi:branched-chain amino acid transport system permease protein